MESDGWRRFSTGTTDFRFRQDGSGPSVVLLHGFPETARAWKQAAPILADRFTVTAPDLPGYGFSRIERPDEYDFSKRGMARDLRAFLDALGLLPAHFVGHDRGARVAYRYALDFPDDVESLTVLGTLPNSVVAGAMDCRLSGAMYHWHFLAQPYPLPETLLEGRAGFFIPYTINSWSAGGECVDPETMEEYIRAFNNPDVIHAACEDYRAGTGIDLTHDSEAVEKKSRIAAPVLVIWGTGTLGYVRDPVAVWQEWADQVEGVQLESGHFLMEERPFETAKAIGDFITRNSGKRSR